MASKQGICKNCGSLIMLNDREELCECLFCDCVFPSAEAIEIAKNPGAYTFPHEKMEKHEGVKKYNVTPVYPDPIPAAVKRAEATAPLKVEKNPYEVSPDDIKAPRKTLWTIVGITLAIIVIVVGITFPLYRDRMDHRNAISSSISDVFSEFTVDTTKADGYYSGFSLVGQTNGDLAVTTKDAVTNNDVLLTFEKYADLRAEKYGIKQSDFSGYYGDVTLTVYAANGIYNLDVGAKGDLTADHVTKKS
ncbi:MAG: hypothetical protein WCG21_13135 [Eubacteriales bacterium]